ncbi:unnamed protein product [Bursaphelenchus xylophilus]|uniref:(pine wood nematode) hypothetical protein n=1 Tax=Bursaphelenchus xylophilus TaxID=6326 RepID=A0A1I7RJ77_BURXY|nr:unnamed protein product [Bursaphelenchus xylophilus]CAG9119438.1 unnamed protein product [Bursaphelenchus xylophilus]
MVAKREKNEEQKYQKNLQKALKEVRTKHDSVVLSENEPSNILFAVHTSFKAAAMFPDVQNCFSSLDKFCELVVYPEHCDYKNYIFVRCSSTDIATEIKEKLNGTRPEWLKQSTMPFYICYSNKIPQKKLVIPKGLTVIENAISEEQEELLMGFIEKCSPSEVLKNRTVIHFGHVFDYSSNTATTVASDSIPEILTEILKQSRKSGHKIDETFDQVTINVYEPGQGIPMHVDTHSAFEEQICVINLCSDIVMKYRDCANNATSIDVLMPRRAIVLMEGASRYKYKHGILNRRYDVSPVDNTLLERQKRISITFRTVRKVPCECPFPEYCDWDRNGEMARPQGDDEAARLESKYVNEVYENIADHFDITRFSRWPAFSNFLSSFAEFSVLLDAGCGNGKYLAGDDKLVRIGSDICHGLLKIAYQKSCAVVRCDNLSLAFKNNSFDGVLCAAVIHHFSTEERRVFALKEITRVLRVGGRALVSGWAMDQAESQYEKMRKNKKTEEDEVDTPAPPQTHRLTVHDGTIFTQQDMLVPWESNKKSMDGSQFLRYYHLFAEGEMENLVGKLDNAKLIRSFYEQGNWFVEFEKI